VDPSGIHAQQPRFTPGPAVAPTSNWPEVLIQEVVVEGDGHPGGRWDWAV